MLFYSYRCCPIHPDDDTLLVGRHLLVDVDALLQEDQHGNGSHEGEHRVQDEAKHVKPWKWKQNRWDKLESSSWASKDKKGCWSAALTYHPPQLSSFVAWCTKVLRCHVFYFQFKERNWTSWFKDAAHGDELAWASSTIHVWFTNAQPDVADKNRWSQSWCKSCIGTKSKEEAFKRRFRVKTSNLLESHYSNF